MTKRIKEVGTVYSTESGRLCPACGHPLQECLCKKDDGPPPGDGIVRISHETKGRKGKGVTVIRGLPLSLDELKLLAKKLKQKCGTGGTQKDYTIEIQGDHREILIEELVKQGYTVKRSGG